MDEFASTFCRVYNIGLLPMLLNQVTDHSSNLVGGNIWQEEETCVQWLNSKKPNSLHLNKMRTPPNSKNESITKHAMHC
ncbi:hypothetical protein RJ639_001003 [Escallonia herrerae]|uniref:Uncharacterized protein n=1 Tax=Escallonia herrerae TaxID=1293975 RepID=A0AA88XAG0_9ASTE|nr:hypothetical protein RJ639_001003 [Escallonia herrerae]